MKLDEIVRACEGELLNGDPQTEVGSFSTDTRTLQPGALYIPIKGENFDGHAFITKAFEVGAKASLTSSREVQGANLIYVADTKVALQKLAHAVVVKAGVPVVAVTGSVGKTSTRDMIGAVVASQYRTLKTEGNYNNDIGLPLTILRYRDEEAMVLEMGMNHLGEIDLLSRIANPDIAVITNVGTAHIGNLGSRDKILEAKMEIVNGLKDNGVLIVNQDNDKLAWMVEHHGKIAYQIKTFGIHQPALIQATEIQLGNDGSHFVYAGVRFDIPVPGEHFILNALSAIAVGECLGIPLEKIQQALAHFELTKKRMDFEALPGQMTLIDGSYNANLDSMVSSLAVLGQQPGRKIAVLADMLELGEYSQALHYQAGQACNEAKVDLLITVGKEAQAILEGASEVKHKKGFMDNASASAFLRENLAPGDVILVKGSNAMHLKEIINDLKEIKA